MALLAPPGFAGAAVGTLLVLLAGLPGRAAVTTVPLSSLSELPFRFPFRSFFAAGRPRALPVLSLLA